MTKANELLTSMFLLGFSAWFYAVTRKAAAQKKNE